MKQVLQYVLKFITNKERITAITALAIALYSGYRAFKPTQMNPVDISYFLLALKNNIISHITYDGVYAYFKCVNLPQWNQTQLAPMVKGKQLLKLLQDSNVKFRCIDNNVLNQKQFIWFVLYFSALGFLTLQLTKRRTPIKSSYTAGQPKILFSHIYGLDHAKKQLGQVIDFLKDPTQFKQIGARLRRGIMIYGPPGTGKTMLAQATATESKIKFIYCSATEFIEIYVGTGPKRVRDLFNAARAQAPAIIFIDEIDSVAFKRRNQLFANDQANDYERVSTLNQLLAELDGFTQNENIIVIAATNRIQILDDALMRSGRFDIKIQVNLPNLQERAGVLEIHLAQKQHQISKESIAKVAQATENFSSADMENITNESAYIAIENHHESITDEDFEDGFKKVFQEKIKVDQYNLFQNV